MPMLWVKLFFYVGALFVRQDSLNTPKCGPEFDTTKLKSRYYRPLICIFNITTGIGYKKPLKSYFSYFNFRINTALSSLHTVT